MIRTVLSSQALLPRRQFIICSLASALIASQSLSIRAAPRTKLIDLRRRSEDRSYGLTFAAKNIDSEWLVGHAFVIWQAEDDANRMSISDAIGFYPAEGIGKLKVLLGGAGVLKADSQTDIDVSVTALVNSDRFIAAKRRAETWRKDGEYALAWSNCVSHVADIARTSGLAVPESSWTFPQNFVNELIDTN